MIVRGVVVITRILHLVVYAPQNGQTPHFFPEGSLSYNEELSRLEESHRKAIANSEMMTEIQGDFFSPTCLTADCKTWQDCLCTGRTLDSGKRKPGGSLRHALVPSSPTLTVHWRADAGCASAPSVLVHNQCFWAY